MIYCLFPVVRRPALRNAPSQFIPFDPFLSGGMYCSAPHGLHALKLSLVGTVSVTRSTSAHCPLAPAGRRSFVAPGRRKTRVAWRALGCIAGSRLQPSHGSGQNVLCVKYFICKKLRNT